MIEKGVKVTVMCCNKGHDLNFSGAVCIKKESIMFVNKPTEKIKSDEFLKIGWSDLGERGWLCPKCYRAYSGFPGKLPIEKAEPETVKIVCEVNSPLAGENCFVSQKIASANHIEPELREELDRQEFVRLGWTENRANRWVCPVCKPANSHKNANSPSDCMLDSIRSIFNILFKATKDGAAGTFEYSNDDIEILIKFK